MESRSISAAQGAFAIGRDELVTSTSEGVAGNSGKLLRDEDKKEVWNYRNLLSFDGGGVRGLWSLLVLEKLMEIVGRMEEKLQPLSEHHDSSFSPLRDPRSLEDDYKRSRLAKAQRYLPCHYFDLICGSSTGAYGYITCYLPLLTQNRLIAIMLGRLRMTVPDCIELYRNLAGNIFGDTKLSRYSRFIIHRRKYDTTRFENIIKEVVANCNDTETDDVGEKIMFSCRDQYICQTFVTTIRKPIRKRGADRAKGAAGTLFLIRSYDHIKPPEGRDINYGYAPTFEVWQAARAASAAPFYFKPLKGEKSSFSDGAVGPDNNPSLQGLWDIQEKRGEDFQGVVVSIGTCRTVDKGHLEQLRDIFDRYTDPEPLHRRVEAEAKRRQGISYFRFNDPEKLPVSFDEWKPSRAWAKTRPGRKPGLDTIEKIRKTFQEWFEKENNQDSLADCARELVNIRRARAADTDMWERYAECGRYNCPHCERGGPIYHKEEFKKHLEDDHKVSKDDSDKEVEKYRQSWKYPPTPGQR